MKYIDPTGMRGQKEETGTPYFKNGMQYNVIDGLNLLDNAVYGPDMIGTPRLKPVYDNPYAQLFAGNARYEQKVNLSNKIGRSLPTGMGNSHADGTSQISTNATNPDASIEAKVTAEYKGFGKNRRITEWTLILPMLGIPEKNLDNGSNSHTINIRPVPDKGDAMDFMARNPELIEGILRDAGMLEYKEDE